MAGVSTSAFQDGGSHVPIYRKDQENNGYAEPDDRQADEDEKKGGDGEQCSDDPFHGFCDRQVQERDSGQYKDDGREYAEVIPRTYWCGGCGRKNTKREGKPKAMEAQRLEKGEDDEGRESSDVQ